MVLTHGDLENELFKWFCSASVKNIVVDGRIVKEKVDKITEVGY